MIRILILTALLIPAFMDTAHGIEAYEPIPGSCRIESRSNNWCHCEFVGPGNRGTGSISCSALSCEHYKSFETDRACNFPRPSVSCIFLNPGHAGGCLENFSLKEGASGRSVCESTLTCLQNSQCIKSYCSSTPVRTGWSLEKVVEHR